MRDPFGDGASTISFAILSISSPSSQASGSTSSSSSAAFLFYLRAFLICYGVILLPCPSIPCTTARAVTFLNTPSVLSCSPICIAIQLSSSAFFLLSQNHLYIQFSFRPNCRVRFKIMSREGGTPSYFLQNSKSASLYCFDFLFRIFFCPAFELVGNKESTELFFYEALILRFLPLLTLM